MFLFFQKRQKYVNLNNSKTPNHNTHIFTVNHNVQILVTMVHLIVNNVHKVKEVVRDLMEENIE